MRTKKETMSSSALLSFLYFLPLFLAIGNPGAFASSCEDDDRYEISPIVYQYKASAAAAARASYRVTLGALFPLHLKGNRCSNILKVKNYNGFQRMEAMVYALDFANSRVAKGNRKVAIDAEIRDTCSNPTSSIAAVLEMMKNKESKKFVGLIGASYSSVSTGVSQVLQTFNVSMLSYASTSVSLSDRVQHPLFARVLPADDGQTVVVYDLVKNELNWQTVEVLTTEGSDYSKSLLEELKELLKRKKTQDDFLCKIHEIDYKNETDVNSVLDKLMGSNIDGIIGLVTADTKVAIINAVKKRSQQPEKYPFRRLRVVATDSWDIVDSKDVSLFLDDQSFVVLPDSTKGKSLVFNQSLEHHFQSLSPETEAHRNPWIEELWRSLFNCTTDAECKKKRIDLTTFDVDSKVDFAFESVMVYSEALENCFTHYGVDCLDKIQSSDTFYKEFLTKIEFDEGTNYRLRFDCGNRKGVYAVYKIDLDAKEYRSIGTWYENRVRGERFNFNDSSIVQRIDVSQCKKTCGVNQYMDYTSDCCYECATLGPRAIKLSSGGSYKCQDGDWPNDSRDTCLPLKVDTMDLSSFWPTIALIVATFGIFLAVFALAFSLKHFTHTAIKNSGRDLGAVLLVGVLICHLNTYLVFLTTPSKATCTKIRFTMTVGYTLMLSALLLKTNRIYRIFSSQFKHLAIDPSARPRCADPGSQVFLSLALTAFQLLLVTVWIIQDPPVERSIYPEKAHIVVCALKPMNLFLAQFYNILLCIVTTIFSILTRDVQVNFNESKWINIAMYSVCFGWIVDALAWTTENQSNRFPERSWAVSTMTTSLMGSILVCFIFGHRFVKVQQEKSQPRRDSSFERPQFLPMSSQCSAADEKY